jgi:TRAP-type C4-dicarboxylate transport system permease small subunit
VKVIVRFLQEYLEEYLLAVLLVVISCVMLLQIVMRYFFSSALSWPEELSRYCFVYSTFLTIGYCAKKETLLHVDILTSKLPRRIQNVLDLSVRFLTFLFYVILLCNSVFLTQKIYMTGQKTPALRISFAVVYFAAVFGFFIGSIRCGQDVFDRVASLCGREAKSR